MNENVNTESAESNIKNEDFAVELQKYWKKILSSLGDDFQSLANLSLESDYLGIIQSLNLIEEMKQKQQTIKSNENIKAFLSSLKDEVQQQNKAFMAETDQIQQVLLSQQQIELQNQEMLFRLVRKQEENKKRITEIQIELQGGSPSQSHNHKLSLPLSLLNQIKSQLPQTTYNSPVNREIRQQSMYNQVINKTKLTQVPIKHNDYTMRFRKNCKQNVLF